MPFTALPPARDWVARCFSRTPSRRNRSGRPPWPSIASSSAATWEAREAEWRAGFRELYQRPPGETRGIDVELHALKEPALRGVVTAMIDDLEDPAGARAALAAAFDGPTVADLRLYALGDGGQLAGVEVAARLADDRGLFLVLLLD